MDVRALPETRNTLPNDNKAPTSDLNNHQKATYALLTSIIWFFSMALSSVSSLSVAVVSVLAYKFLRDESSSRSTFSFLSILTPYSLIAATNTWVIWNMLGKKALFWKKNQSMLRSTTPEINNHSRTLLLYFANLQSACNGIVGAHKVASSKNTIVFLSVATIFSGISFIFGMYTKGSPSFEEHQKHCLERGQPCKDISKQLGTAWFYQMDRPALTVREAYPFLIGVLRTNVALQELDILLEGAPTLIKGVCALLTLALIPGIVLTTSCFEIPKVINSKNKLIDNENEKINFSNKFSRSSNKLVRTVGHLLSGQLLHDAFFFSEKAVPISIGAALLSNSANLFLSVINIIHTYIISSRAGEALVTSFFVGKNNARSAGYKAEPYIIALSAGIAIFSTAARTRDIGDYLPKIINEGKYHRTSQDEEESQSNPTM